MVELPDKPGTAVYKRSISIEGHKTSISLEKIFWDALKQHAAEHSLSIGQLVRQIDEGRNHVNLSSAIRIFLLENVKR